MLQKDRIEFVIPVYDESDCLDELMRRLLVLRQGMSEAEMSVIFVNDGSQDGSLVKLVEYAHRYSFVRVINFSRNFGHQAAVTAGLDHADAEYVCIIDADLQDAPELVKPMYEKAKKDGLNVVYGQRCQREGESVFKVATAKIFYKLMRQLCSIDLPADTGDFRLIDRKVFQGMRQMREAHRFLRGMVPWVGFRSAPLLYDRDPRYAGKTKYTFLKMVKFAMDGVLSFSNKPLRLAAYMGFSVAALGFIGLCYVIAMRLLTHQIVPGITVVLTAVLLVGGAQLLMLGLIGAYIGRLFEQSKNRPLYLVDFTLNLSKKFQGEPESQ